jgi:hypothetical protein
MDQLEGMIGKINRKDQLDETNWINSDARNQMGSYYYESDETNHMSRFESFESIGLDVIKN